jgi:predicted CXXCH cytochrome family protein
MQRQLTWWIWIMGLVCVVLGMQAGLIYSQDEEPEYVSIRECRSCHGSYAKKHADSVHGRTLLDVAEADNPEDVILADFDAGEDIRTMQFPDGETRAFTADDVAFTLGVGRHYQAYVTEVDDGVYRVLPAEWRIADETWVPISLADDWSDSAYDFNSQCAGCHTTNYNADDFTWGETGVQCEACHGPGSNHVDIADDAGSSISDSEYADLSGAINFALDSQVCGQCHSRGTNLETGLPFPVGYRPGKNLLDEAIFTLPDQSDTHFWYSTGHAKLPNMQFNEWLESAHVTSLETAQSSEEFQADCLTCHSVAQRRIDYLIDEDWVAEKDFDKLSVLDRHSFGITCTACHDPHEVDNEKLLIDEDRYDLCTTCHTNDRNREGIHHPVREMFEGEDFVDGIEPVAGVHFSAEDGPQCITCHMSNVLTKSGNRPTHTFAPIVPDANGADDPLIGSCASCHDSLTNGDMRLLIDGIQENVRNRLVTSSARLATFEPDPDSDAYESYLTLKNALTFVQNDGSLGVHNYAYADKLLTYVEDGLTQMSVPDVAPLPTEGPAPTATPPGGIQTIEFADAEVKRVESGVRPMTRIILGIVFLLIFSAAFAFFRRSSNTEV